MLFKFKVSEERQQIFFVHNVNQMLKKIDALVSISEHTYAFSQVVMSKNLEGLMLIDSDPLMLVTAEISTNFPTSF